MPIVNEAVVNYFTMGVHPEETINNCDRLIKFQKIVKLSGKYDYVMHNDRVYHYKCYRVFASKDGRDGKIYKCRKGNNPAKFGNTPDKCFIMNDDITDIRTPRKLNKQWYIDLAKERLYKKFGVEEV